MEIYKPEKFEISSNPPDTKIITFNPPEIEPISITIITQEEIHNDEPRYLPCIIFGCIIIYTTVIYLYPQIYIPYGY